METYVDVFVNADGKKASLIIERLLEMGLKPGIGEHDFIYDWKGIVDLKTEIAFVDSVQEKLYGTGAILKFTTVR